MRPRGWLGFVFLAVGPSLPGGGPFRLVLNSPQRIPLHPALTLAFLSQPLEFCFPHARDHGSGLQPPVIRQAGVIPDSSTPPRLFKQSVERHFVSTRQNPRGSSGVRKYCPGTSVQSSALSTLCHPRGIEGFEDSPSQRLNAPKKNPAPRRHFG